MAFFRHFRPVFALSRARSPYFLPLESFMLFSLRPSSIRVIFGPGQPEASPAEAQLARSLTHRGNLKTPLRQGISRRGVL